MFGGLRRIEGFVWLLLGGDGSMLGRSVLRSKMWWLGR